MRDLDDDDRAVHARWIRDRLGPDRGADRGRAVVLRDLGDPVPHLIQPLLRNADDSARILDAEQHETPVGVRHGDEFRRSVLRPRGSDASLVETDILEPGLTVLAGLNPSEDFLATLRHRLNGIYGAPPHPGRAGPGPPRPEVRRAASIFRFEESRLRSGLATLIARSVPGPSGPQLIVHPNSRGGRPPAMLEAVPEAPVECGFRDGRSRSAPCSRSPSGGRRWRPPSPP